MQPIIIYPPTLDWDYLHQRPQQLFKALANLGCICVFCNLNLHRRHADGFVFIKDNLVLANGQCLSNAIQWARKFYPHQPITIYFTYPPQVKQILFTRVDLILFDSVDEPSEEFAGWFSSYHQAVQTADIVIATARSLVERASAMAKEEVLFLPNGCDYEHFTLAQTKQPVDSKPFNEKKPIIGYIGSIAPWVDIKLINVMAHYLPDYEFVLIGPLLCQRWVAFTSKNIEYLGHKDYCELPRFLSNFSYCLIPFKLTPMTKGVNPVKLWEYLASGIPILSTPLPEVPKEYVTIIQEDMFPGFSPPPDRQGHDARIALARNNSWNSRAAKLLETMMAKLQHG